MIGEEARWFVATMKWFLGGGIALLVLLLGWQLFSPPTIGGSYGRTKISCQPIVGPLNNVSLTGADTSAQERAVDGWLDRLELGRTCHDARTSRQSGVGITLATLVVLLAPVGLYFVVRMRDRDDPLPARQASG